MFGLFNKTEIKDEEIQLLRSVIEKLPTPYSDLITQINDGLLRGVIRGASDIPGYVAFTFHSNILKKYDRESERDFKLSNIKVYDRKTLSYLNYEIYVSSSTISGYSLGNNKKNDIDINRIDVSNFKKVFFSDFDYKIIENLFTEKEKKTLNPSQVYSVIINDSEYFHLKDIGDGDFIGIDKQRNIFKIKHDPLSIEKINETIESIMGNDV